MSYPSDPTVDQWHLPEPVFHAPGKRSRTHADDLRSVVDAMLSITKRVLLARGSPRPPPARSAGAATAASARGWPCV
jgi:hypothetical protein